MKPRHELLAHTPEELAAIATLDAELAHLSESFARHGATDAHETPLTRIADLHRQLDALRPEWKGRQYRSPIAARMEAAAANLFNQ